MDKLTSLPAQNPKVYPSVFYTHDEKGCQKILSRFFSNSNITEHIRHSHPVLEGVYFPPITGNMDSGTHHWIFADIPLNLLGGGVRRPVLRTTAYTRRPRYQTSRALRQTQRTAAQKPAIKWIKEMKPSIRSAFLEKQDFNRRGKTGVPNKSK